MRSALLRPASLMLLCLSLAGCGQTGRLFLRMPLTTFPPLAPPLPVKPVDIAAPPGGTSLAPVSATAPQAAPSATTRP
jgi:predicted small lipoprotein YifL